MKDTLKDILKNNDFYHLSKLAELGSPVIGDIEHIKIINLKALIINVTNFKEAVIKKRGSLNDFDYLRDTLEKIEFVFDKLNGYFTDKCGSIEARVMFYTLGQLYKELIEIAEEIDEGLDID